MPLMGAGKYPHDQRQGGTMEVGAGRETRLSGRTSWGSILNASVSHRRTRWKKAEGRRTVQSCEPGDISLWFFMLLILVNIYVLKWNRFL